MGKYKVTINYLNRIQIALTGNKLSKVKNKHNLVGRTMFFFL